MARPLRAGVVGTGFIGPVHVEALRRIGVDVVGIVGSNLASTQAKADQMRLLKAYSSLEEMIGEADLDCVHITTPNYLHAPMVKQVLRAGKHVVCEKPLAMNAAEGQELLDLARAGGCRPRREFQHPLLPPVPSGAGDGAVRRAGHGLSDPRPLPAGLAAEGQRLELAAGTRAWRRHARRGRHRLALARSDDLHRRPADRLTSAPISQPSCLFARNRPSRSKPSPARNSIPRTTRR